uniref:Uncharacterized protein n=1 Tax=Rhizophora mucronata TaxID=61149 RepID=A0A2P2J342_RHIMU
MGVREINENPKGLYGLEKLFSFILIFSWRFGCLVRGKITVKVGN